nr:hypothetical protein [Pseudomonas chengduensis]
MGLFDRLFGGRFTAPPPDETDVSDDEILRELKPRPSSAQRKAMKALLEVLLARTPDDERQRLIRRVDRRFDRQDGAEDALSVGLLDSARGQKPDHWMLLRFDWRGFDGFEYLAPIAVKASGILEAFSYSHAGKLSMPEVLSEFDAWLALHGRRYVHIDSGGDEYQGAIVPAEEVEEVIRLASVAGLSCSLECF